MTAETRARVEDHWSGWQASQAAHPEPRFTDWGDHPEVLACVYEKAFGDPSRDFLTYLSSQFPALQAADSLSICCGDGGFERALLRAGLSRTIVGQEIAAGRIEQGIRLARDAGLEAALTFMSEDVNSIRLEPRRFDAVFAKAALHHIQNLEHALPSLANSLKPDGLLITIDFFGPTRFQWTREQLVWAERAWQTLVPQELHLESDGSAHSPILPPDPLALARLDPSEAVRSGELYELFLRHFDPIVDIPLGGTLLNLVLWGDRVNLFRPDEPSHCEAIRAIHRLESDLISKGVLASDFRFIVAAPRQG